MRLEYSTINEQKAMNPLEAREELGIIIQSSCITHLSQKGLPVHQLFDELSSEVAIAVFRNADRVDRFIRMVIEGNGAKVFQYCLSTCKSVSRDIIQKKNIDSNTLIQIADNSQLYFAKTKSYKANWTEYNFKSRLSCLSKNSDEYLKIKKMSSKLEFSAVNKVINKEKLTEKESNAIHKLRKKIVSTQLQ